MAAFPPPQKLEALFRQ